MLGSFIREPSTISHTISPQGSWLPQPQVQSCSRWVLARSKYCWRSAQVQHSRPLLSYILCDKGQDMTCSMGCSESLGAVAMQCLDTCTGFWVRITSNTMNRHHLRAGGPGYGDISFTPLLVVLPLTFSPFTSTFMFNTPPDITACFTASWCLKHAGLRGVIDITGSFMSIYEGLMVLSLLAKRIGCTHRISNSGYYHWRSNSCMLV